MSSRVFLRVVGLFGFFSGVLQGVLLFDVSTGRGLIGFFKGVLGPRGAYSA